MFQKIEIIGYLGQEPEMRYMPDGKGVTQFSVATSNKYTNAANEVIDETTWFRVSVFGKQADACNKYLKKGSLVFAEGRLKSDPETGNPRIYAKKDGNAGTSFEMVANNVKFLPSANKEDGDESKSISAKIP